MSGEHRATVPSRAEKMQGRQAHAGGHTAPDPEPQREMEEGEQGAPGYLPFTGGRFGKGGGHPTPNGTWKWRRGGRRSRSTGLPSLHGRRKCRGTQPGLSTGVGNEDGAGGGGTELPSLHRRGMWKERWEAGTPLPPPSLAGEMEGAVAPSTC